MSDARPNIVVMKFGGTSVQDAEAIRRGREAFDCAHLAALDLHGECEAGPRRLAVDGDGAGAAHAVFAADMGARKPQMMAQTIGQRQPRLDFDLDRLAVNFEFYRHGFVRYAAALLSARSTMTPTSALR